MIKSKVCTHKEKKTAENFLFAKKIIFSNWKLI